jgi:P pilus assembly chaperone PapD
MTVAALALLGGAAADRPLVAVTVSASAAFAPRRAADGRVVNAFDLVLENRDRTPVEVALSLDPGVAGAAVTLRPAVVGLEAGEIRRLRVVAMASGLGPAGARRARLVTEVRAVDAAERRNTTLSIVVPEVP